MFPEPLLKTARYGVLVLNSPTHLGIDATYGYWFLPEAPVEVMKAILLRFRHSYLIIKLVRFV
jgi:hypothetical protein